MSTKNLLTIFVFTAALACNNSSTEKSEAGKDSTAKDTTAAAHDTMHHDVTTSEVAALPAIPDGASVSFKNLKNGATVTSPFKVEMVANKMSVDTANGKVKPASGHHHILINLDSVAAGQVIPKDSTHLHFGNAQTSAEIKLPPGKYKLTLQFADALHRSYGGKLTSSVNVTVKK